MRPLFIPAKIKFIAAQSGSEESQIKFIQHNYSRLRKEGRPLVSIVIPAYNEEKNILPTLYSMVCNRTNRAVEIIVVNNNSTDRTGELVQACGLSCVLEKTKGITAARNAGLKAATGTYIINADSDTIYPENWIDRLIDPLEKGKGIALTYGRFSFIPCGSTPRWFYFFYEHAADIPRYVAKYLKEEAVNVGGCNSAFRKEQGVAVGGFNHPEGANEDGFLALKLRDRGFGKLAFVTSNKALAWTTDRRIEMEGGMLKGLKKRISKFFFPQNFKQLRTDI